MNYVIVFRSRLRPGVDAAYSQRAGQIYEIAATMPGLMSATDFVAEDGERCAIIEFDTLEHLLAWRDHPEHLKVQQEGRDTYYASYSISIAKVERASAFDAATGSWKRQGT